MAVCDEGYLCAVCGEEVEDLRDSDLYLRFVLGEVDPETLHLADERHLRCNPTLSQFIVAEGFAPVEASGPFARSGLDPEFVAEEQRRVTAGYLRLVEVFEAGADLPITDYPLPGAAERWRAGEARGE